MTLPSWLKKLVMDRLLLICSGKDLKKSVGVLIEHLNLFLWICRCLLRVVLKLVLKFCNFKKNIGREKEFKIELQTSKTWMTLIKRFKGLKECCWGLKALIIFLNKN